MIGSDPADLHRVGEVALEHVRSGMLLGLGTGRAAEAFIERLGEAVHKGLHVKGIPTSERSAALARRLGIEVISLEALDRPLDIAFDGADEVTPELALTKGRGGALLRERVVAHEAERFIVLVTPEKLVDRLGSRMPIPIEVVPFACAAVVRNLQRLGAVALVRASGDEMYRTDNANFILDTTFGPIDDPARIDAAVRAVPGVVDTGIFLEMADLVLVGDRGSVRELRAP